MADKALTGKVFDIQGFSVHDGPGIRTTVFLKGCNLHCPWCHSPESQRLETELCWMEMRCVGIEKCGVCLSACHRDAVSKGTAKQSVIDGSEIQVVVVDREKCDDCGACAAACSAKALYMCGTDYAVDEIIPRLLRDAPFYNRSGGGVTVSGGECLCQPEFTLSLLKASKAQAIHTAVDTAGHVDYRHIEAILPFTDLFLYDLKSMNSAIHKKVIGVPNERILENARKIARKKGKLQVRIPTIPRFNDSEASFAEIGRFVAELGDAVTLVQLLPYHNLGTVKYERLRRKSPIFEAKPPTDELMNARKEQLEGFGLSVVIH
ncbi:MAG TPA: glycyl-radical enzyme activating protein [Syntrophorhabdales bacterium]|nr:glycyl-radical enzyme activating protein [Syntrophorhabdales bacterium]